MTPDAIAQQLPEKPEPQVDSADMVVGILAEFDPQDLGAICDSLRTLPERLRVAILHEEPAAQSGQASGVSEPARGASLFFMPSLLAKSDPAGGPVSNFAMLYQSVLAAGEKLQA